MTWLDLLFVPVLVIDAWVVYSIVRYRMWRI